MTFVKIPDDCTKIQLMSELAEFIRELKNTAQNATGYYSFRLIFWYSAQLQTT